jgi:hypothetical protein
METFNETKESVQKRKYFKSRQVTKTTVVGGATTSLICGIPRAGSENILGGTTITNHSEEYECFAWTELIY